MNTTVLVGWGAHGKDLHAIAQRCGRRLVVTDEGWFGAIPWDDDPVLIGVNDPQVRREVAGRWPIPAIPLVDTTAVCGPDVYLSDGVVIAPQVTLLRDVTLGVHTHVNYHASMTRCTIGDYCTIAPGVTICGDVTIGDGVFIGAGATICNLVSIGDNAVVGAGAVVLRDVPSGVTVVGVPASPVVATLDAGFYGKFQPQGPTGEQYVLA